MRALHVLHHSAPLLSGYSIRTETILLQLERNGISVEAVTSAQHEGARDDREIVNGLAYRRTRNARATSTPLMREWLLMQALERTVRQAIRDLSPDVVHAHSPVLVGLPALRAARAAGVPLVYEIRDLWENTSVDLGKFSHGSARYRLARAADTYVLRRADAVVTICENLRTAVRDRVAHADRLFVVPNGVNPAKFAGHVPEDGARSRWRLDGKRIVAYIGTFQPYEGLELLVEAMPEIVRAQPRAHLLIAGNGDREMRLRAMIQERGLQDAVTMTGPLPHAEVAPLYAMADVMAYPRLLTRTTALTTPLKPLEAMAMGKAVLVSDVPAMLELVSPGVTGAAFKAGDVRELQQQVLALLGDDALRMRLGSAARQWVVANRDWRQLVSIYSDVYAAVTGATSIAQAS